MWDQIFSTEWTNLVAMLPLAFCSILVIAIVLERLVNFNHGRQFDEKISDAVIEKISNQKYEEAIDFVSKGKTLQEQILYHGLVDCFRKKVLPEVSFLDHGLSKLEVLTKWLSVLSFIAKIAPLFGLLGTVLGMIDAFDVIANLTTDEGVKPQDVAGGIGTALITTASGLMVAIPALIVHSVLSRAGQNCYNRYEDSLRSITIACGGLRSEKENLSGVA